MDKDSSPEQTAVEKGVEASPLAEWEQIQSTAGTYSLFAGILFVIFLALIAAAGILHNTDYAIAAGSSLVGALLLHQSAQLLHIRSLLAKDKPAP